MLKPDVRMLEAVGLNEEEEALYSLLLDRPSLPLSEIAQALGKSRVHTRAIASTLETKGLLSRSTGKPVTYMPTSPELSLEGLIVRRQEELDTARLAARELEERFRRNVKRASPIDLVEAITPREAIARQAAQLQRGAKEEVLGFDKPPYVEAPPGIGEIEAELLRRGVRIRAVYELPSLERSGGMESLTAGVGAGEEARVASSLPMKLMIIDRRVALIPLYPEPAHSVDAALIVHPSSLLDALIFLWDSIWERATPVSSAKWGDEVTADGQPQLAPEDKHLLMLLLAGLKAQAIARQLDMGVSTVERRTKRIMETLGAETRFQAGFKLARSGLFDDSSGDA